jgi:hypothetical protein
MVREKGL